MNVTLGVPRLRELLMVASIHLKTPTMEVPILHSASALRKAKRLQSRWSRLLFSQVLANLTIQEKLTLKLNDHQRTYRVEFQFDQSYGKKHRSEILRSFEMYFLPRLCRSINKKRKELTTSGLLRSAHIRDKIVVNDAADKDEQREEGPKDDDDDDDDDENEQPTGEANRAKEKANRNDEKEYDDEEMGENETDDDDDAKQDPVDGDEQTKGAKVNVKEDMIDEDDDLQGKWTKSLLREAGPLHLPSVE